MKRLVDVTPIVRAFNNEQVEADEVGQVFDEAVNSYVDDNRKQYGSHKARFKISYQVTPYDGLLIYTAFVHTYLKE